MADATTTGTVWRIVIKASAQAVWDALTRPEWSERYGYGGRVSYDMRAGGRFQHAASAEMKAMGMPEIMITGDVIASEAPHRLEQTWHPLFAPPFEAEPPTRITYEIAGHGAVSTLTLTHKTDGAPMVATMVQGGGNPAEGHGGWPWVLSDLKSLLETGKRMAD